MNRDITPISESEESKIRREYTEFVLHSGASSCNGRLHLPDDGSPLCERAYLKSNGDKLNGNRGNREWITKNTAVYPPGHKSLCKYCTKEWRNDEIQASD